MLRRNLFLASILALPLACGGADKSPKDAKSAKSEAGSKAASESGNADGHEAGEEHGADAANAPGVQDDGSIVTAVEWYHGAFDEAVAAAKKDDKLLFVDIGAYWCPPCNELDEKTFIDPKVGSYLGESFVALHIDAEKGEGPELVERYHVQVYPSLLVLEASGVEKARLVDFHEPAQLINGLDEIKAGGNVLAELAKSVEEKPDDLKLAYEYGSELAVSAQREAAEVQFAKVMEGDPKNEQGLAAKVLYDRAMFFTFKLDKDNEGAIAAYRDLQARFPKSKEGLRAYRQIGRVYNTMGKADEAIASLDAMVATDPEDVSLKSSYGWFSFRQRCQPAKGLAVVKAGIEKEPEAAGLRYLAAELHSQLGQASEALASIKKASELEPKKAYYRRQILRFEKELADGGAGGAGDVADAAHGSRTAKAG